MPFIVRTHRRYPICCPLTYEIGHFHGDGMVANLSAAGIRFFTTDLLYPGQVCAFTINLPSEEKVRVAAAIVRWILDGDDDTHFSTCKFGYGMEMLMADARAKHQIMEFLSSYNVTDEIRSLRFRSQ